MPQSKQTTSSGNTYTLGLSISGKWMQISSLNFCWLTDPHDLQGMSNHLQIFATFLFLIYCRDVSSAVMSVTEICDCGRMPHI